MSGRRDTHWALKINNALAVPAARFSLSLSLRFRRHGTNPSGKWPPSKRYDDCSQSPAPIAIKRSQKYPPSSRPIDTPQTLWWALRGRRGGARPLVCPLVCFHHVFKVLYPVLFIALVCTADAVWLYHFMLLFYGTVPHWDEMLVGQKKRLSTEESYGHGKIFTRQSGKKSWVLRFKYRRLCLKFVGKMWKQKRLV